MGGKGDKIAKTIFFSTIVAFLDIDGVLNSEVEYSVVFFFFNFIWIFIFFPYFCTLL